MKSPKPIASIITSFLMLVVLAVPMPGQTTPQDDAARKSELGVRQRLVERKMVELETKLTVIAEKLREKEPKRAELLVAAYQQSKEQLITKKMAEVSELLDNNQLPQAEKVLDEVIQDLEALIRLLTQKKDQEVSKQEEMKQLERWKKSIENRLQEQRQQINETEKVANKEEAVQKLEAQIKKLEGLIGKQKDVIKETEAQAGQGLRALDKVADKQFEVRKGTDELKDEIGGNLNKDDSGDQKSGDQKPGDQKPGDQKPGDQKPGDQKPGDQKPGDQKPGDQKPDDQKPGDQKPARARRLNATQNRATQNRAIQNPATPNLAIPNLAIPNLAIPSLVTQNLAIPSLVTQNLAIRNRNSNNLPSPVKRL